MLQYFSNIFRIASVSPTGALCIYSSHDPLLVSLQVTVKCIFMTDFVDNRTSMGENLTKERTTYNDMEFQNLGGGVEFGKRFMYHMVWAMQNYDFDYFLRMDDDYYFCLQTFLYELPMPRRSRYHWGYVHCQESIVRPEESIILLSRDLVEKFLSQDPGTILCHPWADQMIGIWVQALDLKNLYNHDTRLHHHPPVSQIGHFKTNLEGVCRQYIGLHGSYPADMRRLWDLTGVQMDLRVTLEEFTVVCDKPQVFQWSFFTNEWKYKPKLCIEDPNWDTYKQEHDQKVYIGRESS